MRAFSTSYLAVICPKAYFRKRFSCVSLLCICCSMRYRCACSLRCSASSFSIEMGIPVGTDKRLCSVKPMARTLNNAFHGAHKLLLLAGKDTPPHQFGCLAFGAGRKAVKGAFHIVERQHTVLALNIFNYLSPMFVIV